MRRALSALLRPVLAPAPRLAPYAGLAFSPEGWAGPERRPLRRHPIALPAPPAPPRTPLGRYVMQGAAMLAAMGFVFWVAALIS